MNRDEIVGAMPICTKCGKPLNEVVMPFFQHDGSDAEERRPVTCDKNNDGTYAVCIDASRNWCGYDLCDSEKKEDIRCPHCKQYPFDDESEIEESEPLVVLCWTKRAEETKQQQPGNAAAGNTAKLHEALKLCMDEMCTRCRELAAVRGNPLPCLNGCEPVRKAKAALAEPPRNCDKFGGDYKMLHTAWFDWTGSPSGQNADGTVKLTFDEWLLAPAAEQEGGGDGSK